MIVRRWFAIGGLLGALSTGCSSDSSVSPSHGGDDAGPADHSSSGGRMSGSGGTGGGRGTAGEGGVPKGLFFSPYKDANINMNWNTNVVSTNVSGSATSLVSELTKNGAGAVTLAFATGECGSENWAGVPGSAMASANVPLLSKANLRYVVSTGGAAGVFTCGTDAGFAAFLERWASPNFVGVDFDIEAGQTESQIGDLVRRVQAAQASHPALRYSLTLATLANNDGAGTATSLGEGAEDAFNVYGDHAMAAVKTILGFTGDPSTWPAYLTVNLMTMDYGAAGQGVCVVQGGACQMGQSAIQAAYNLHDKWSVPYGDLELTPMIGGNDVASEQFTLADVETVTAFAVARGLAGVHYWSYDRDTDCAPGSASSTCSSMGASYAGPDGYLKKFLAGGLR